ncbi:acid phosphatase [Aureobasidium sp. EXF-10728]|nr:acid phosphatase [Aureobasidium sp. EXF-10728]
MATSRQLSHLHALLRSLKYMFAFAAVVALAGIIFLATVHSRVTTDVLIGMVVCLGLLLTASFFGWFALWRDSRLSFLYAGGVRASRLVPHSEVNDRVSGHVEIELGPLPRHPRSDNVLAQLEQANLARPETPLMYIREMRLTTLVLILLTPCINAANIVLSNDDGWAEMNIHTLYERLKAANHSVSISAPAINQSATGSSYAAPKPMEEPCQYFTCNAGDSATGYWYTDHNISYVNSFPATAMKYGIEKAEKRYGRKPDVAISGINLGNNLSIMVPFSGTIGAATQAAILGIPAISFSGSSGTPTPCSTEPALHSKLYAELAVQLTSFLLASGAPYLPPNTFLNVNFPAVGMKQCSRAADFKFVLSRLYEPLFGIMGPDVSTCGAEKRLPSEWKVVSRGRCYVSISVGVATTKRDAAAEVQEIVRKKLGDVLACLA